MKNAFADLVRDIVDALGRGDRDYFAPLLTDDVVWRPVGKPPVHGKEAVLDTIAALAANPPVGMTVQHVITHGSVAAANGTLTIASADGGTRSFGFCDLYAFSGFKDRKIKELILYVIPLETSAGGTKA